MHADGDRAVHEGLDAIEALRTEVPRDAIRAAIAHDEIGDPADFPRLCAAWGHPGAVVPVGKARARQLDGDEDYMGPERFRLGSPPATWPPQERASPTAATGRWTR